MKYYLVILLIAISLLSCTNAERMKSSAPDWVMDLENKNPHKDDCNMTSVYFRYDTVINSFEISGILYPNYSEEFGWSSIENGVRLLFYNPKTGEEYIWTDWSDEYNCFKNIFRSKNVCDIVCSDDFQGFQNCDYYTFQYDTTQYNSPQNVLLSKAEFQFYDIDFDGEDELLMNFYHGGPKGCTYYQIFEMLDGALVKKGLMGDGGYFTIDDNTEFNPENKTIISYLYSGFSEHGTYAYKVSEHGDIYPLYHASTYVDIDNDTVISDTTYYEACR